MSSNNITRVFINEQESVDKTDWVINQDGEVLVPTDGLTGGDKVVITIDNENSEYQEGCLLSIFNKDIYKDLSLEVEAEFNKTLKYYPQNIELICRATSVWDKSFLADEYYAFGIKDSRCYLAKVSYHYEKENSFAYKQMMDIGSEEEQIFYFKQLSDEQQEKLGLGSFKYNYNEKYVFRTELKGDLASFYVKRLSSSGSVSATHDWIPLFKDISVRQDKDSVSNRAYDLERTIHVTEPITTIDSAGFYGIVVPNSYVKIYRAQVKNYDELEEKLYDDVEYSKNVSTEFSETYKTKSKLKFASSDSRVENRNDIVEIFNIKEGSFVFGLGLNREDIERVTVNNIELQKGVDYEDRFISLNNSLGDLFEGSEIGAYVDTNSDIIGQKEEFVNLGKGDGISRKYRIDEDAYERLRYYPDGKVGAVLVEFDSKYILNTLDKVGLKEDIDRFVTKQKLMNLFNGRNFFVEMSFRNKDMVVDMGPISSGKYTYEMMSDLTVVNDSYEALWKYKHAEWIDNLYSRYKSVWVDGVNRQEWDAIDGIGYVLATLDRSDAEFLLRSDYTSDFESLTLIPDGLLSVLNRVPRNHVKAILKVFRFDRRFTDIILDSYIRSTRLRVNLEELVDITVDDVSPSEYFDYELDQKDIDYLEFREKWLEFEVYNNQFGFFLDRKFYYSLFNDEYNIEGDVITIYDPPSTNRSIQTRIFYNNYHVLTDNYSASDSLYKVPKNIQDLHDSTDGERGLDNLYLSLDLDKLGVMNYDGMTYIAVPDELAGDNLLVEVDICGPFIREDSDVSRNVRVPLKPVSDVLGVDPSKNKYGEIFDGSNRVYDLHNDVDEFVGGDESIGDFSVPRIIPTPDDSPVVVGDTISIQDIQTSIRDGKDKTGFFESLFEEPAPEYLIDRYLNVSDWYNVDDTVYSPFHKKLVKNIVDIKSLSRTYGEFNDTFKDPFLIEDWFHGFYSGELTSWTGSISGAISGSNSTAHISGGRPWGTENSRKDMLTQLKETISGKFEDHTLYYVDLSQYESYNKTSSGDIDSGYINPTVYPISGNDRLIINPAIDPDLPNKLNPTYPDGFLNFTNLEEEYSSQTVEAIDSSNYDVIVRRVHRFLENDDELNWDYNHMILLKDDSKFNQAGSYLSTEFEYSHDPYTTADNSLNRISQKVSLGENDGTSSQLFPNPDVFYRNNISYSDVHKIWVDNYIDTGYDLLTRDDGNVQFELGVNPESNDVACAVTYKSSNYLELNNSNDFIDNFYDRRDVKWVTLTRDRYGFLQKPSSYDGYEIDSSVFPGKNVWRKAVGTSDVSTAGTAKASSLIKGYRVGSEEEDVIEIIDLKRNNNFEIEVDIYFDEEETKDNMTAGLVLRGDFNILDDKQYMTNYYTLLLNFQGDNIALIGNQLVDKTFIDGEILVTVSDDSSLIKRGVYYTLRVSVIKDEMKVFLKERDKQEKFYFSYNFSEGTQKTNIEDVVTNIRGGLGITDYGKVLDINGDRLGLFARGNKTYFMDFRMRAFEYDTVRFGNPFVCTNYDHVLTNLRKTYNIAGDFKKMRKTYNGYEYILLGTTLFSRIIDGTFQEHSFIVDDFEVIGKYIYVVERKEEDSLKVLNMYERMFKRVIDFNVDSKQFVNEPVISYLNDLNAGVVEISKEGDSLFIKTDSGVQTPLTWDSMTMPWDFYTEPWNVYG